MIDRLLQLFIEQVLFDRKTSEIECTSQAGKSLSLHQCSDSDEQVVCLEDDFLKLLSLFGYFTMFKSETIFGNSKMVISYGVQCVRKIDTKLKLLKDYFLQVQVITTGSFSTNDWIFIINRN